MATHATGMAHPRQTTLATMAHSLSESVVGSMASARSLDVHSDKTHRMSGAKRARTSIRLGEGAERSAPSQSHSRSRWRTAENPPVRSSGRRCRRSGVHFWRLWFRMSTGRVLWTAPPRAAAWSVAWSGEFGNIRMGSAPRTSGGFAFFGYTQRCRKAARFPSPQARFRANLPPVIPLWERGAAGCGAGLRVFVRIRIYGVGGIFRISIRPACAFRHNRKSRQGEWGRAFAGRRRAGRILKIL